ncbi:50S ribosome-binding GTPase [Gracilaria domingensis]|nr:50S ribosome-binding GTPase [Gracilaria domingensis]
MALLFARTVSVSRSGGATLAALRGTFCRRWRPPPPVVHQPNRVTLMSTRPISTRDHTPEVNLYTSPLSIPNADFQEDTIFALSSGAGVTAGVAVIRISGPHATACLRRLLSSQSLSAIPPPRYAALRRLYHPTSAELLDEALVLYFPSPKSFTGEDVVELHVHGSRAVISAVIDAIADCASPQLAVRPAERGEFTRRAFENGQMDLTAVEGLADLIASETAMQRKQALRQFTGHLKQTLETWRADIKTCLAHVEAVIDFGDDVDDQVFEQIIPRIRDLRDRIQTHLHDSHRGEIIRGGARVAIVGEPNAGKSTLLNALAKRPAAIVSPHAGTTRDVVEVQMDLNGLAVTVSDTAGLRDSTNDPIEIEGMRRARDAASRADVTVLVHDVTAGDIGAAIRTLPNRLAPTDCEPDSNDNSQRHLVCVLNKVDLVDKAEHGILDDACKVFQTSLLQNEGLTELVDHLESTIRSICEGSDINGSAEKRTSSNSVPIITRARHRHHMKNAVSALDSFLDGRSGSDPSLFLPMDLAAEDLRIAAKELGAITGKIDCEEVLDLIFKEFCIGK